MPKTSSRYPQLELKQNQLIVQQHKYGENCITAEIIKDCIVENLKQYPVIDNLTFLNVDVRQSGLDELAIVLKDDKQIKTLVFSTNNEMRGKKNYFETGGSTRYDDGKQFSNLVNVVLYRNWVYSDYGFQKCTYYFSTLGNEGAKKMAEVLKEGQWLTSLQLCYQNILPQGIIELTKAVADHPRLRELVLTGNFVGAKGTFALAEMLKKNRVLKTLTVQDCAIDSIIYLADALDKHDSLQDLDLRKNELSDSDAKMIADGLPKMSSLRCMRLSSNKFSVSGVKWLLSALVKNKFLHTFSMSLMSSEVDEKAFKEMVTTLKAMIACNNTLAEFFLMGTKFSDAKSLMIVDEILEVLAKNYNLTVFELPLSCELLESQFVPIIERNKAIQQAIAAVKQLIEQPLPTELEEQKKLKQQIDNATKTNDAVAKQYPDFVQYCQDDEAVKVAVAKFNKRSVQLEKLIKIHEELNGLETKVSKEFTSFVTNTKKDKILPSTTETENKWQQLKEQSSALDEPEQKLLAGSFSVIENKISFFKSYDAKGNQSSTATNILQTPTLTKGSLNDD